LKRKFVFIFNILFLGFFLLCGCKSRETGIIQNAANFAGEEAMALTTSNDSNNLINTTVLEHNNGITNNDGVGIFESPSFDASVIKQLDRGILVAVLGRSRDRMFFDGHDSFWLRVKVNGFEGWSYGAYVNLLNSQYESLSVLSETRQISNVYLNWPRNLPKHELIQKEREAINLQTSRFMDVSIQEFYEAIVRAFNLQQSLRPFFLNTQEVGIYETGTSFFLSSSSLSDFIQAGYIDNITISPLMTIGEESASFVINGFKKMSTFIGIEIGAVVVNIKRIDNTSFNPLNGKTVIDLIVVSPYSAEDFIELSWGDVVRFNTVMTIGTFHSQRTRLLQMILGEVSP